MTVTLSRVSGRTSLIVQPEAVAISMTTSSLDRLAITWLTRGSAAGALAHVARGLLDHVLLEHQLFVDAVLEVDVGIVHTPDEIAADEPLHEGGRDVEPIGKEFVGADVSAIFHGVGGLQS